MCDLLEDLCIWCVELCCQRNWIQMKQSRMPQLQPKWKKGKAATAATTNNDFEMLALKHYKAFQFIQIKWDCFYFSCRLPKNKRNYYWISFRFVLFVNLFLYLLFIFPPLSISLNLNVAISFRCWSWLVQLVYICLIPTKRISSCTLNRLWPCVSVHILYVLITTVQSHRIETTKIGTYM